MLIATIATVWIAPILVYFFIYRELIGYPRIQNKILIIGFSFFLIFFLLKFFGWNFKVNHTDEVIFIVGYSFYCYGVSQFGRIKDKFISLSLKLFGYVPIIVICLSTPVWIFIFGLEESESNPLVTGELNPNYSYKIYPYGFVTTSDEGNEITIYRNSKLFPFLETELMNIRCSMYEYNLDSLNLKLEKKNGSNRILIYSGNKIQIDTLLVE